LGEYSRRKTSTALVGSCAAPRCRGDPGLFVHDFVAQVAVAGVAGRWWRRGGVAGAGSRGGDVGGGREMKPM
jgi:hypothetical protein